MTLALSACLIVRDEAEQVGVCIAAVAPYVDEVVVADTGSHDGTRELAADAGARVIEVLWTDDFAAARNAATEACSHDWVLSLDADERPTGDPAALRALLADTDAEAVGIELRDSGPNPRGPAIHRPVRLFRRTACHWQGRVHEEIVARDGDRLLVGRLPEQVLALVHSGYADPAVFVAKVNRNLRLARLEVDGLVPSAPPARRIAALLDLGRTQLAAGERAEGSATLREVRGLADAGTPGWVWATDFLAWDALRHDDVARAWELVVELAENGADDRHVRPLTERLLDL